MFHPRVNLAKQINEEHNECRKDSDTDLIAMSGPGVSGIPSLGSWTSNAGKENNP
jgi:hypothetical protein